MAARKKTVTQTTLIDDDEPDLDVEGEGDGDARPRVKAAGTDSMAYASGSSLWKRSKQWSWQDIRGSVLQLSFPL